MWFLMNENIYVDIIDYTSNFLEKIKTFWNRWHRALWALNSY